MQDSTTDLPYPLERRGDLPYYENHFEFLRAVKRRQDFEKSMRSNWKMPLDVEADPENRIVPHVLTKHLRKNSFTSPGGGVCRHPHSNMPRSAQEGLRRFEASEEDLRIGRMLEARGL